jgi:hypothetical protein
MVEEIGRIEDRARSAGISEASLRGIWTQAKKASLRSQLATFLELYAHGVEQAIPAG